MDALIQYFKEGHSVYDILCVLCVIAAVVVCIEQIIHWIYKKFLTLYKKKRGEENNNNTIEQNSQQIKDLTESINNLSELINDQYNKLNEKIEDQRKHIKKIDEEGKNRDIAFFRDRLIQGIKYFSRNKDTDDVVHISLTDYENLNSMFREYFNAGGNGVVKHLYETEFQHFKINNDTNSN